MTSIAREKKPLKMVGRAGYSRATGVILTNGAWWSAMV